MTDRKRTLVFASNNSHKLQEIRQILGDEWVVKSLKDIGCNDDIPETADTLEGNALLKAKWVKERYGVDCFADDTGLEVEALGGEPGVYSARYAGDRHDSQANMRKLLQRMEGVVDRRARFRTAMALICGHRTILVDGEVKGEILKAPRGDNGFGYDPVFMPQGCDRSFAEMTDEEKNSISHRRRATEALKIELEKLNTI